MTRQLITKGNTMSALQLALLPFGALTVFFMLASGTAKVLGQPAMRGAAQHFSIAWEQYRRIGYAEIAAAAAVVSGVWLHPVGLAAGLGVIALMAGAITLHVRRGDSVKAMTPALLCLAASVGYTALQLAAIAG